MQTGHAKTARTVRLTRTSQQSTDVLPALIIHYSARISFKLKQHGSDVDTESTSITLYIVNIFNIFINS